MKKPALLPHPLHRALAAAAWLALLVGCSLPGAAPTPAPPAAATPPRPAASPTHTPAPGEAVPGLSADQAATLGSLERVDDYPLYTMRYYGSYARRVSSAPGAGGPGSPPPPGGGGEGVAAGPACELFAALGDPEHMLYGRNFDWEYSPALLLFTDPPDGYASVSMVDIAYLGFGGDRAGRVADLPLAERQALLRAPYWPFDGMNEHGLAVGMAAVPPGAMRPDPAKQTIDSLGVIREILDRARDVDQGMAILRSYNVDMGGGPPLHYLLADPSGRSVLVEFYQGRMVVMPNQAPWHAATNFLRAAAGDSAVGECWRYDTLQRRLAQAEGRLAVPQALELLGDVSQPSTQWSVVYGMSSGQVDVVMGRGYDHPRTFPMGIIGRAEP